EESPAPARMPLHPAGEREQGWANLQSPPASDRPKSGGPRKSNTLSPLRPNRQPGPAQGLSGYRPGVAASQRASLYCNHSAYRGTGSESQCSDTSSLMYRDGCLSVARCPLLLRLQKSRVCLLRLPKEPIFASVKAKRYWFSLRTWPSEKRLYS